MSGSTIDRNTWQVTGHMLRRFLPGEIGALTFGVLVILCATAVGLLQPWPLKLVIDSVLGHSPPPAAVQWLYATVAGVLPADPQLGLLVFSCAALLFIELTLGGLKVASTYLLNAVALRLVFRVRRDVFDHLQRQSLRQRQHEPAPVLGEHRHQEPRWSHPGRGGDVA